MIKPNYILEINNLSIGLPKRADRKYAVENANIKVSRGEVLCVVGESGSGKSVMTSAILNDIAPGRTWSPPRLDPEEALKITKDLEALGN